MRLYHWTESARAHAIRTHGYRHGTPGFGGNAYAHRDAGRMWGDCCVVIDIPDDEVDQTWELNPRRVDHETGATEWRLPPHIIDEYIVEITANPHA